MPGALVVKTENALRTLSVVDVMGGLEVRGCNRERKFSKTQTDEGAVLLEGRKAHLELNLKREKGGERNMAERRKGGTVK